MAARRFRVHLTREARFSSFASALYCSDALAMKLTNDSYLILMGTKNFTESYFRDKDGWLKISSRGRKFRMTAEQVLNHLLPAVAGVKPNLIVKVEHRDFITQSKQTARPKTPKATSRK